MTTTATCYWHPDRETRLQCGRCGKYICVDCIRQHPVGVRCKECARAQQLPMYQVSASYYLRGIAAAVGSGLAALVTLSLIFTYLPFGGFFFVIFMGLAGYAVGEAVGAAVNKRRGRPYQYMALSGALLATLPWLWFGLTSLSIAGAFNLIGVGIALMVAWARRAP